MNDIENRLKFLGKKFSVIQGDIQVMREISLRDVNLGLNKIRYITEKVLFDLCEKSEISWGNQEPTLENMIGPLIKNSILPKHISTHVRSIQSYSSPGSHYQKINLTAAHINIAQMALVEFLEWHFLNSVIEDSPIREDVPNKIEEEAPIIKVPEKKIKTKKRIEINFHFKLWHYLVIGLVEIVILISIILINLFPILSTVFKSPASQSGLYFFEGVLKSPGSRILLFSCIATGSLILALFICHLVDKYIKLIKSRLLRHSVPQIAFTIIFILFSYLAIIILRTIDPISNLI